MQIPNNQANSVTILGRPVAGNTAVIETVTPLMALGNSGRLLTLRAGETFLIQQTDAFLGILVSGAIDTLVEYRARRLLFNSLRPGDVFPIMIPSRNAHEILSGKKHYATQTSNVRLVSRAELFEAFERHPELALRTFIALRRELARLEERMEEMASYSLPVVVARLVVRLTLAQGQTIAAGLTQQRMADWLGTNRETLLQILKTMRAQGLILMKRKYLEVLEPAALCDLADGGTGEWSNGRLPTIEPIIFDRLLSHTR